MIYVGDANDPATILADADVFYSTWFSASDDDEVAELNADFDPFTGPPYWEIGMRTSALVQMYDLIAPLDPARAGCYLERLRRIADALLANRDDKRHFAPPVALPDGNPVDPFRGHALPAWGGFAQDRDGKWNTDVVTAGLFTYAMAAFARRVADNPALQPQYGADAIRFTTAVIETYTAFRPEMHLDYDGDPQAYFTVPAAYADLKCSGNHSCEVYRSTAGQPLAYNENLSMMKALAEASLAGTSALYLKSNDSSFWRTWVASYEAPLLIAKNFTFFNKALGPKKLSDGTPYFLWNQQFPKPSFIQNTAHGGFELGCLAVLLDDKIPLNALLEAAGRSERVALSTPLFVRFANTFLRKIWHYDYHDANGLRNVLSENVNEKGDLSGKANWECAGWIPLAQFDPWVWTRCRDVTWHARFDEETNISYVPGYLREDNHAALLRYRQFNQKTT